MKAEIARTIYVEIRPENDRAVKFYFRLLLTMYFCDNSSIKSNITKQHKTMRNGANPDQ